MKVRQVCVNIKNVWLRQNIKHAVVDIVQTMEQFISSTFLRLAAAAALLSLGLSLRLLSLIFIFSHGNI